ncbi:MAG: hypothetical protein CMJ34_01005 [Phycisphaerae bacterium]|nr:hypothetical protein [Phycisphaerae bacterium]
MIDLKHITFAGRSLLLPAILFLSVLLHIDGWASAGSSSGEGDQVDCLYDNPSFEMGPGLEGNAVSGWSDSGNVGLGDGLVSHGRRALWLYGPFNGKTDSSRLTCLMEAYGGWSYALKVDVGHLSTDALEGAARAFFTIRWRNSTGGVIAEEAVVLLNSLDATDVMVTVQADIGPAPVGTRSAEIEFSFRQTSAQESGRVWIDAFRLDRTIPGVNQWSDFGSRRIDFAGHTWRVKNTYQGPGPNQFSDSTDNARVQSDGSLFLGIDQAGPWRCAELAIEDHLGYGTYRFVTRGRLDQLDPNVVFGLFIWEYVSCYENSVMWWNPPNEFDIEFSRWGDPDAVEGQFVAQPYDWPGNIFRFDIPDGPGAEVITSEFRWEPEGMYCRAWIGTPEEPETLLATWFYDGPHHPRPGRARVHLNLWLISGNPPQNGQPASVVLDDFIFIPRAVPPSCLGDLDDDGQVDSSDIGLLIAQWGGCHRKVECTADLDDDGIVDASDLGLMIGAWGSCSG